MKVCTDACVLGAFADVGAGGKLLDIGTGTGLLALMAAQRNPTGLIDAIEIDNNAFTQAVMNVIESPFAERIQVTHGRIQDFLGEKIYNRILTNPPFYTNHLRSPNAAVNRALHTDELSFSELLTAVLRLLKAEGQWWVLLPPYEMDILTRLALSVGLSPFKRLSLRHHVQKPVFRVIRGFSSTKSQPVDEELSIYESDNRTYTVDFRALLRDYYLIF